VREARELFMRGEFEKAATTFPRGYPEAFHLCKMLARNGGDYKRALFSMDRGMLKFYVSALQSELFNEAVARRIGFLDEVRAGDWAHKHDSGGAFRVDDQAAENPRALRFEISAMGPLFGSEMRPASGEPLRIEEEILKGAGLARGDFEKARPFTCQGDRRPLRFKMEEVSFETGADPTGDYLKLRMVLPSGCYATSVLRELGKDRMNDEARVGKSATA
jgi:tRNA(Glu) U13 pseudouridine synthase TruD